MGGRRSASVCSIGKKSPIRNGKYKHYSKERSITPRGGPKTPPETHRKGSYSISRSPSTASMSPKSRSCSPDYRRRRQNDSPARFREYYADKYRSRERPKPNRCIGVFGLSVFTSQHKIREIFEKFGPIERIQMVVDQQTGRSRGFCFIYYEEIADAKAAKEECCGIEVDHRRIRVDFSITQRPHTPTPGIYMGHTTRTFRGRSKERGGGGGGSIGGPVGGGGGRDRLKELRQYDDYRPRRPRSRSFSPDKSGSRYRSEYKRRREHVSRSRSRSRGSRRSRYY